MVLREIVRQVQHLEMKLVAGEAGLDREVVWTHMVDSAAISVFLQGKELVFTTGIGLTKDFPLLALVQEVYRNGASGIVVNLGPYIDTVGEDVKAFAQAHAFPVFEVPWNIHMAEVMRIICLATMKEQQNRVEVNSALNYAFLCPEREELYVPLLMRKGYLPDRSYAAAVLRVHNRGQSVSGERIGQLSSILNSHFRCNDQQMICCTQEAQMVLVLGEEWASEETLAGVFQAFCHGLEPDETAVLCVGKVVSGLRGVYKSYGVAKQMADLCRSGAVGGETWYGAHRMLLYQHVGMFRLLLSLTDEESMREYVAATVQPVLEYDALHGSDLAGVLQCYLRHDCSLQETADELIVHRNTVNYKINKVSQILSTDLTKLEHRLQVSLGFAVARMLEKG